MKKVNNTELVNELYNELQAQLKDGNGEVFLGMLEVLALIPENIEILVSSLSDENPVYKKYYGES